MPAEMEVESMPPTPVPPPLPPRSPKELKKMEQPKKAPVVSKGVPADNYPKVSLQVSSNSATAVAEGSCESAEAAAAANGPPPVRLNLAQTGLQVNLNLAPPPESPAVVAVVPMPPQRSVSMVEPTYQNKLNSQTQQHQNTTTVESSSTSSSSTEAVYVNVSGTGGGSVQVCPGSRTYGGTTGTSNMATAAAATSSSTNGAALFQQQVAAGMAAAAGLSSGEVHVHHHHHHHHFYPGPRLNMTSSASELNIPVTSQNPFSPSTNPFLNYTPSSLSNPFHQGFIAAGFANSGYGVNSSSSSSQHQATTTTTTSSSSSNNQSPFPFPRLPISTGDLNAILRRNTQELQTCGWYHGSISMDQANRLLHGTPAGTFLVRDSSASDCMYALTFQQDAKRFPDRCANSVRIRFFESSGKFQLDPSNNCKRNQLPEFDTVIELVEFYSKSVPRCPSTNVLLDENTGVHYPINLTKPLAVERGPRSLQHLSKLAVHQSIGVWSKGSPFHPDKSKRFGYREKNLKSVSSLDLPLKIKDDLAEYAYTI